MIKKLAVKCKLILVPISTLLLISCGQFEYSGDYPELYSVAINSILGHRGVRMDVPTHRATPNITVIREDNYGRRLFSYTEDRYNISLFNRVIIQKVEGDYAYFYPHYNFISGNSSNSFPDERMRALKAANSWNRPMSDSSEFERVRIVRQKEEGPVQINRLIEVYREIFPESDIGRTQINYRMVFLRTDRHGRSVYLASRGETFFAVLFQPDHSFNTETDMLEIEDPHNYQTELRLFMEANGWNEAWYDDEN